MIANVRRRPISSILFMSGLSPNILPRRGKTSETVFHRAGKCPNPVSIAWKTRAKHVSIVWKSARNLLPLCGKIPETPFHCVEKPPKPVSIVWKLFLPLSRHPSSREFQ
jgi:hypothetical protein